MPESHRLGRAMPSELMRFFLTYCSLDSFSELNKLVDTQKHISQSLYQLDLVRCVYIHIHT